MTLSPDPTTTLDHIWCADALDWLRSLPDNYVNCIITSPPYWGLRNYGVAGQVGLEPSMKEYLEGMVAIFHEARRVLRPDGVCFVNMGDSYASAWAAGRRNVIGQGGRTNRINRMGGGLKEKDLCGIPWRLAFALQDDGWCLRNEIIWHKPNCTPEAVTDRFTRSHEHIFMLTKQSRYWFDQDAVREAQTGNTHSRGKGTSPKVDNEDRNSNRNNKSFNSAMTVYTEVPGGRNRRTVWVIPSRGVSEAHFATFPVKLVEPMLLASCPDKVCCSCGKPWKRLTIRNSASADNARDYQGVPEYRPNRTRRQEPKKKGALGSPAIRDMGFYPNCEHKDAPTRPGIALDMFMGSGTVGVVAKAHHRHWLGCDLNPEYIEIAEHRIAAPPKLPKAKQAKKLGITQRSLFGDLE